MSNLTFLHNGGGWATNIGNAFLDMGSMELVRQASPESSIYLASVMNRWYSNRVRGGIRRWLTEGDVDISNVFNIQYWAKADFVVQAGAFLGEDWFKLHGPVLERMVERGARLIIAGGGMTDEAYTESAVELVRQRLEKLKPFIFISRDRASYESFHDLAEHSYDGIDVAFFLADAYPPMELDIPPFIVLNFDKTTNPDLSEIDIGDRRVIRVHHSFFKNFFSPKHFSYKYHYFGKGNTMISDIPYGYLNLYAAAEEVYSDRVHACVGAFVYGTPARLFSSTPRARLLERIDKESLLKELTYPDLSFIQNEKEKQVRFLESVLSR